MFYIRISNGLLKDGHRKRMGAAVWEFMWCLDRVTRIDHKGEGWVLGGKPIKLEMIADSFPVHRDTVSENLKTLEEQGYIRRIHAPHGIVIRVMKAKKRFGESAEPRRENTEPIRLGENTEPNIRQSQYRQSHKTPAAHAAMDGEAECIDAFKDVNPSYANLFRRSNQREAVRRMLARFGREKLLDTIRALPGIINKPFAPRITTPMQLEEKLGQLVAFVKQEQGKTKVASMN